MTETLATVEGVMSIAFELARIREEHGAQSGMYLSEVRALRAEVERLAAQSARTDGAISRDNFSGEQLRAAYEVSTARGYSPEGSEAGNPSTPAAGNFAEWARVWHDTASTIATIAGGDPNLDPRGMIESVQVAQSAPLQQAAREYPSQKYDDVLLPFLTLMRKELHANSGKGDRPGWLAMDANTALLEVYWHTAKLSAAVKNNDGPAIMEHSADVANMAMMVLDVCGGLVQVDADRAAAQVEPDERVRWHRQGLEQAANLVELEYAPDAKAGKRLAQIAQHIRDLKPHDQKLPVKMLTCARVELVTAIHTLASHFENTLYALNHDREALAKAKGDIAHALKVAAAHNYNGAGCRVIPADGEVRG